MTRAWTAGLVDAALVLVFVVAGRRTHDSPLDPAGVASTAWPFIAGLAVGWLAARAWRRPAAVLTVGVPVWVATVAVGMALRALSDQGTAPAFVIVTTLAMAVMLLGWRLVAGLWVRSRISSAGRATSRAPRE